MERADEVGEVREPDVERDVGDRPLLVCEKLRRMAQPRAHQVLVRRDAERARKKPQEMERTQSGRACHVGEVDLAARMRIDPVRRLDGAASDLRAAGCCLVLIAGYGFQEARSERCADFVEPDIGVACGARLGELAEHRQFRERRQRARAPRRAWPADRVDQLRGQLERQALVGMIVMVVGADVFVAGIPDHE